MYVPGAPRTELLLGALKAAIASRGEHRLFRSGKLAGLFPSRAGSSSEAALAGHSRGIVGDGPHRDARQDRHRVGAGDAESCGFVHDHDSPKSVLRELKELLDATRCRRPGLDGRGEGRRSRRLCDALRGARRGASRATGRSRDARGGGAAASGHCCPGARRAGQPRWCRGRSRRSNTSTNAPSRERPATAHCRNSSTRCG